MCVRGHCTVVVVAVIEIVLIEKERCFLLEYTLFVFMVTEYGCYAKENSSSCMVEEESNDDGQFTSRNDEFPAYADTRGTMRASLHAYQSFLYRTYFAFK